MSAKQVMMESTIISSDCILLSKREPYLDLVQSRNQRAWLTRLRCSAHHLEIEKGRWLKIPINDRICKFCNSDELGDEFHFVMKCSTFSIKRACFIGRLNSILPGFSALSSNDQFKMIMCPTKPAAIKVINQYFRIMFLARDKLSDGQDISDLSYPTLPVNLAVYSNNFEMLSDVEDEWDIFDESINSSFTAD